jgi:hypothetical protein
VHRPCRARAQLTIQNENTQANKVHMLVSARTDAQAMSGPRTASQSKRKHPSKQSAHVSICAQVHRPCLACAHLHNSNESVPADEGAAYAGGQTPSAARYVRCMHVLLKNHSTYFSFRGCRHRKPCRSERKPSAPAQQKHLLKPPPQKHTGPDIAVTQQKTPSHWGFTGQIQSSS